MFTGIIRSLGKVESVSKKGASIYIWIKKPAGWKMGLGESVGVDGICSTVKRLRSNSFEVEYMPETIKKTTAEFFRKGASVNLERSLHIADRLDGHLVQGHVDTTGTIEGVRKDGNSVILKISFPKHYHKFIAVKGSICVNGVSLTVVATGKNWFTVSLVSYTLEHTNLGKLRKGGKINLEIDMLARYLDALLKK